MFLHPKPATLAPAWVFLLTSREDALLIILPLT